MSLMYLELIRSESIPREQTYLLKSRLYSLSFFQEKKGNAQKGQSKKKNLYKDLKEKTFKTGWKPSLPISHTVPFQNRFAFVFERFIQFSFFLTHLDVLDVDILRREIDDALVVHFVLFRTTNGDVQQDGL